MVPNILLLDTPLQGWVENSIPGIYGWNLPVFSSMANKAQVANITFCRKILANIIFSCKMQQVSLKLHSL